MKSLWIGFIFLLASFQDRTLHSADLEIATAAGGQTLITGFSQLKSQAGGDSVPARRHTAPGFSDDGQIAGRLVPAKFRVKRGPGAERKQMPNLTKKQRAALLKRLILIPSKVRQTPSKQFDTKQHAGMLSMDQMRRLYVGMEMIDTYFVDPIPTPLWDRIIAVMGDKADVWYSKTHDWDVTIDAMLTAGVKMLKDPHSEYLTPKMYASLIDNFHSTYSGIGIIDADDVNGRRIRLPFPNSGAAAAGLRAGDVITEINGISIAQTANKSVAKMLRGPAGTFVTISIIRNGEKMPPIRVRRSKVRLPDVFSKMITDKIGYFYISEFNAGVDKLVIRQAQNLLDRGADSIILDVRDNPGGSVEEVSSIASEFLKNGQKISSFRHQNKIEKEIITDGNGRFSNVPVAILIDGNSASASEILAMAVQDQRGGSVVIGSLSYGKGSQQAVFPQGHGRGLDITMNRWYSPRGRNIDALHSKRTGEEISGTGGVKPDLVVDVPKDQAEKIMDEIFDELVGAPVTDPRTPDPVLQKAIEILSETTARVAAANRI